MNEDVLDVVVVVPFGLVWVSLIFLVTVTVGQRSGLLILVLAFNLCSSEILLWLSLTLAGLSLSELLWKLSDELLRGELKDESVEEEIWEESDSGEALFFSLFLWQEFKISMLNLLSFGFSLLLFDWFIKNVFSVVNGRGVFFSSLSKSLRRSLLEARKFLKILVLFKGEVSRKSSFFFSDERQLSSLALDLLSLVFLWGEGDVDLFRSNTLNGEEFLESADLSLADVTLSSELNLADFEGECSLIRVGFPGPIVM